MIEIEHKFLVTSNAFIAQATQAFKIKQGFLNTDPERTVRVRLKDNQGYITVKGKSSESFLSRFEWEKKILKTDAEALLKLCEDVIIEKTRYIVNVGKHSFEVDVFEGDNKGLIIAELEVNFEEETFNKPNWLGKNVTKESKYFNSQLSQNPYKNWLL